MPTRNARQLFSTITDEGELHLTIERFTVAEPDEDEVIVEMKAAPINPSDLGLLLAPADMATARQDSVDGAPALVAELRPEVRRMVAARVGQKLPAGNEGAGIVVAAGGSASAQALLGKTVTIVGGMMYRTHRVVKAQQALPLPDGAAPAEGASLFVNPMTVQGFLNTMRGEGHDAIVHTAAASNLGLMLAKLCHKEGVPLVAVVRRETQRSMLADLGVEHIVDSSRESFMDDLIEAIAVTNATLAFDAIGGGKIANAILIAMEQAQIKRGTPVDIYGTPIHKQVYLYGRLDFAPTELTASYGMYWGVGGWLLTPHLKKVGLQRTLEMRRYAIEERKGIFASHYTRTISLDEMINPDVARAYQRKATGEKYLVDPSR
ncbi:MAG: NADH oxidase [Myxococcota bacterium]